MTTSTEPDPATPGSAKLGAAAPEAAAPGAAALEAAAPGAAAARGRFPDFFIVGHAKCGTTALYEMLRRHPDIYMPSVKEPQFFARNWLAPGEPPPTRFEQTGLVAETLEQYLALFAAAPADKLLGEGSTFYLFSEAAPARIAAAQPDAKIVAILREPADFLRSLHLQMIQNQVETERDLRRALALEDARRQGREIPKNAHWPQALIYTDRVRYVEQLRRYREAFPAGQMKVLIYDDFRSDNEGTLREVLRFLGVEDSHPLQPLSANPTVRVRSLRLAALWRGISAGEGRLARGARGTAKVLTTSAVRRRIVYPLRRRVVYAPPRPLDADLAAELRRRFKGEVVALGEYLDRDLVSLWGYGDVS
jgi:hypothetical protein